MTVCKTLVPPDDYIQQQQQQGGREGKGGEIGGEGGPKNSQNRENIGMWKYTLNVQNNLKNAKDHLHAFISHNIIKSNLLRVVLFISML